MKYDLFKSTKMICSSWFWRQAIGKATSKYAETQGVPVFIVGLYFLSTDSNKDVTSIPPKDNNRYPTTSLELSDSSFDMEYIDTYYSQYCGVCIDKQIRSKTPLTYVIQSKLSRKCELESITTCFRSLLSGLQYIQTAGLIDVRLSLSQFFQYIVPYQEEIQEILNDVAPSLVITFSIDFEGGRTKLARREAFRTKAAAKEALSLF